MRLYTFELNQQRKIGAEWQGQLIDLAAAYQAAFVNQPPEPNRLRALPNDLLTFIRIGPPSIEAANLGLAHAKRRRAVPVGEEILFPSEAVRLRAPIPRPGKIICASDLAVSVPHCFTKLSSALIGPSESIIKPAIVNQLHSSPNLAAVIGRRIKNIAESDIPSAIFGYTMLNSISARDARFADNSTLAQNFDTFCPLGPCIITADDFQKTSDPQIHVYLNGAPKQSLPISTHLSSLTNLILSLSTFMTLEPGDIVSAPCLSNANSLSLNVGDIVALVVDGLGRLENPIIGGL